MTLEQKIQKIKELPHGETVWAMICDLRDSDSDSTTQIEKGPRMTEEHPLYDELVRGLMIWMSPGL